MTDPTQSPLASASPDALDRLFLDDPMTHSDARLMDLVLELRRRRNAFTADEAVKQLSPKPKPERAPRQTSAQAAASDIPVADVDLDDLLA